MRYQNERIEARRLQRSGSSRRMKREADSQDLLSFGVIQVIGGGLHQRDESGVSEKDADVREVMRETAGNATRGRGEDAWMLEPEGETETLETKVFWSGVEGVPTTNGGK